MSLILSNTNPDEWGGTFVLTVKAMVDDLLSDSSPEHPTAGHFKATVAWNDRGPRVEIGKVTGFNTDRDETRLYIQLPTGGCCLPTLESITRLEVM